MAKVTIKSKASKGKKGKKVSAQVKTRKKLSPPGATLLSKQDVKAAPVKNRVVQAPTANGAIRGQITLKSGATVAKTGLQRWCGANQFTMHETLTMMSAIGLNGRVGSLSQQLGAGRDYAGLTDGVKKGTRRSFVPKNEPIPSIGKDDAAWLRKLAGK